MSAVDNLRDLTVAHARATWRTLDADALEARADTVMASTVALDQMVGMFDGRDEIAGHLAAVSHLLRVEEDNLRTKAQKMRDGGGAA